MTGANDGPNAVDDVVATDSSTTVAAVLTANDTDPDASDDLEILSVDTSGLLGSVTVDPDGDTVFYDPNGAFDGIGAGVTAVDTFTYTVTDGNGGTDTATVSVTVTGLNDAPDAVDDITVTFQPQAVTLDVLANDSDPNGDPLSVIAASVSTPGAGSVGFDPGGNVTFTPDAAFTGNALISYTASDGQGGTDTATLTVIVIPNSPPVIQEPISFDVEENQTLAANLQATDPEGDVLTWSITGGPDAALFSIDAATGALSFLAPPDFETPLDQGGDNEYNVTVTVEDDYGSDTQGVLVTVLDVADTPNTPPQILAPLAPPGLPAVIVLTSLSQGVVGQVFAIDPDGDTLEYQLFGEDLGLFSIDGATGEISFSDPATTGQTLVPGFDGDRIYELDVLVLDGNGGSAVLDIELPLFLGG